MTLWVTFRALITYFIFESLKQFVSKGEICHVDLYGDFYGAEISPPACVFFARGDNRNIVTVECGGKQLDVLLDGDDTRSISRDYDDESVIQLINALRIN